MITTIEDLADKIEILNENTRELLYKLYLWGNSDVDNVPVNIRIANYPYIQTFNIPTKKHAIDYISSEYAMSTGKIFTKNWGSYSNNEELRGVVLLGNDSLPSTNILKYDGYDVECGTVFQLPNDPTITTVEFLVSIQTSFKSSDNKLVQIKDAHDIVLCSLRNTPSSTIEDLGPSTQTNTNILYKIVLKYVPNFDRVSKWTLFDYYVMPSYVHNGSSFNYDPSFVDPTAQ